MRWPWSKKEIRVCSGCGVSEDESSLSSHPISSRDLFYCGYCWDGFYSMRGVTREEWSKMKRNPNGPWEPVPSRYSDAAPGWICE